MVWENSRVVDYIYFKNIKFMDRKSCLPHKFFVILFGNYCFRNVDRLHQLSCKAHININERSTRIREVLQSKVMFSSIIVIVVCTRNLYAFPRLYYKKKVINCCKRLWALSWGVTWLVGRAVCRNMGVCKGVKGWGRVRITMFLLLIWWTWMAENMIIGCIYRQHSMDIHYV